MSRKGILAALRVILPNIGALIELIFLGLAIFVLLIMIPVWTTPGNDFLFQLELLGPFYGSLMAVLAFGNAVIIAMQIYIHKEVKRKKALSDRAAEGLTFFGLVTSILVTTFTCVACYSSVFAILGLGAAAFFVQYRLLFSLLGIVLVFIAMHYSAKRINHHCEACKIDLSKYKKKRKK